MDVSWHVVTNCVNLDVLEYKVNDTTSDYRITYCTKNGSCENYEFIALTMSTSNGCICGLSSVGIIVGILTTLLITTVTAIVISYVLHRRRWSQEKQSAAKDDREYTGLSVIGKEMDHTYEIPEKEDVDKDDGYTSLSTATREKESEYEMPLPRLNKETSGNA
ncbi:uncharacterized protein LOC144353849 [Saccoglossus kowalevskii]